MSNPLSVLVQVIEDWKKKDFPGIGFAPGKSSVTLTLAGAADVSDAVWSVMDSCSAKF